MTNKIIITIAFAVFGTAPAVAQSVTLDPQGVPAQARVGERTFLPFVVRGDENVQQLQLTISPNPGGAVVNHEQAVVVWTPQRRHENQRVTFSLQVRDRTTGTLDEETYIVDVATADHPPKLVKAGDRSVTIGEEIQIIPSATDPDGDALGYSIHFDGAPPLGHSWNGNAFRWTPTTANTSSNATYSLRFRASDDRRYMAEDSVRLFVGQVQLPAAFLLKEERGDAWEGSVYTVTLPARDPNNDSLRFDVLTALPGSGNIGATTGLIQWTPPRDFVSAPGGTRVHAVMATVADPYQDVPDRMTLLITVHDVPEPLSGYNEFRRILESDVRYLTTEAATWDQVAQRRSKSKGAWALGAALFAFSATGGQALSAEDTRRWVSGAGGFVAGVFGIVSERAPAPADASARAAAARMGQSRLFTVLTVLPATPSAAELVSPALRAAFENAKQVRNQVAQELAQIGISLPFEAQREIEQPRRP
ncbi:hypothetical protein [Longimicrobium sp.]|jgi:hypothetical protein|uniref:hypothetical protein n=1 Tax=Longimicrobium sp. TaxID=2029185 RepID=UPI002ED95788